MQSSTFLLISSELPEQLFYQLGKRKDEHSREDIGNAVDNIKAKALSYPNESLLKIESVHQRLTGGKNNTECKAVE